MSRSVSELSKGTLAKSDETDTLQGGYEKLPCHEVDCEWLCDHHEHDRQCADFYTEAETFLANAEAGCDGCRLLKEITLSRCVCRLGDELRDGLPENPHQPRFVKAHFDPSSLPILEVVWTCGPSKIELLAPQESDSDDSDNIGHVHLDRLSSDAISLYQKWIEDCVRNHCDNENGHDETVLASTAPKRLLSVIDSEQNEVIRLQETAGEMVKYLALSYCWGNTKPPMTTSENLLSHEKGIRYDALPKSYLDTVLLAQKLSIPYIWIDSYCIVQDEKDERDLEISRMGKIFENAFLVVIAAAAPSPYAGYLANNPNYRGYNGRARFKWRETSVRYANSGLDTVKFRQRVHVSKENDACARVRIGKRAWTYQERLFAQRCLIFQGSEVVWECKFGCTCECREGRPNGTAGYQTGLLPPLRIFLQSEFKSGVYDKALSRDNIDIDLLYSFWRDAVRTYSRRDLTYPEDRLRAISALASVVHSLTSDEYLAGLWKSDIIQGLMWQNRPEYDDMKPYDADTNVAPSWSWASTPAPSYYDNFPSYLKSAVRVKLLESHCILDGRDEHGAVRSGYLVLRGVHCDVQATISRSRATNWPKVRLVFENWKIFETEGVHSEYSFLDGLRVHTVQMELPTGVRHPSLQRYHVSTATSQHACSGKAHLLWLEDDTCLLLAYSQKVPGAFERIGILTAEMAPPMPEALPSAIKLV